MNQNYAFRSAPLVCALFILAGCLSQEEPASFADNGSGNKSTTVGSSGNSAPTIWGAPAPAVMTGDNFSFTPTAEDPDGDALTFTIKNKPRWARFDAKTGRLSGQPTLGDEGVYANIVISVSDGASTAALSKFSIEVTQSALGSMTLSWTPPTENEDGSPLGDLAGYNLYYGESEGAYSKRIRINNPGVTTYVVENLLPKTYYVVATAFNRLGVESSYSNLAIKQVVEQ